MGKPVIIKKKVDDVSATVEAELAKVHRVIKIMQLIQSQPGWNAASLASECGVKERTIYRDLEMLQKVGVPWHYDEEHKCYRVRADYFMKPVELTLDEALSVIALGEQIGRTAQIPYTQAATRAVAKIRGQLPERIRRELKALDHCMVIRLGQSADGQEAIDVYAKMQLALARKYCLRCVYESSEKKFTKPFIFKPYTLMFERRAWYVIGLHGGHGEVRCLKLNRFAQVEDKPELSYEVPKEFSLKKHMGNAWRMIRGAKSHNVHLRFDAKFAENIADTHWHDTQTLDFNEDGSLIFRCKVDGLDEIVWWVLSMGPHCEVIEPKELAERIRDMAAETAAKYRAKE